MIHKANQPFPYPEKNTSKTPALNIDLSNLSCLSKISTDSPPTLDLAIDSIQGKILCDRYKVGKFLEKGEHGEIYQVTDLKVTDGGEEGSEESKGSSMKELPLVIKVQPFSKEFA